MMLHNIGVAGVGISFCIMGLSLLFAPNKIVDKLIIVWLCIMALFTIVMMIGCFLH